MSEEGLQVVSKQINRQYPAPLPTGYLPQCADNQLSRESSGYFSQLTASKARRSSPLGSFGRDARSASFCTTGKSVTGPCSFTEISEDKEKEKEKEKEKWLLNSPREKPDQYQGFYTLLEVTYNHTLKFFPILQIGMLD